jgi:hypothetical protein
MRKRDEPLRSDLDDETDDEAADRFWSTARDWERLDDERLANYIKDRFTHLFVRLTGLAADRTPIVRRNTHVGRGADEAGPYIAGTFGLLGTTYFFYGDPDDKAALDEWIGELGSLQAGNFEDEVLNVGPTGLEDESFWKRYREKYGI